MVGWHHWRSPTGLWLQRRFARESGGGRGNGRLRRQTHLMFLVRSTCHFLCSCMVWKIQTYGWFVRVVGWHRWRSPTGLWLSRRFARESGGGRGNGRLRRQTHLMFLVRSTCHFFVLMYGVENLSVWMVRKGGGLAAGARQPGCGFNAASLVEVGGDAALTRKGTVFKEALINSQSQLL